MQTLRLIQSAVGSNRFRVDAALEGDGLHDHIATAEFDFAITPQDREDLRWYLEDYLQYAADPAPKLAARIEARMAELGIELFTALFQCNKWGLDLWAALSPRLSDTRIEIITAAHDANALPWELIRDPATNSPLALASSAFVRARGATAQRLALQQSVAGAIRILLVICRPGGSHDVPFRSVASRIIKGLGASARETFQLDVLRPPTFAQLSDVLRRAKAAHKPYHIVHFDGHGTYDDLTARYTGRPPQDFRGYLAFENAAFRGNEELKDGTTLGGLLAEAGVPVLVLNACRSAHIEAPALSAEQAKNADVTPVSDGVHEEVQAFGSLAQEVMDAGVTGVVAMRYNVYVVTAAQFVADLYASLATGQTLGGAVNLGRKQLAEQPLREINSAPRSLEDWMVPIVYEAKPVTLLSRPAEASEARITVLAESSTPTDAGAPRELEMRPDAGFFGRDETLLALDRAFDTHPIVLLHAYAGSGKSSLSVEFARWYQLTDGVEGPVFVTSFENKKTLHQALNETIGLAFASVFERSGINWLALPDEGRRDVALRIMMQVPVLWIWDNVEPIPGFPAGAPSAWSCEECQALVDFLSEARGTKAKFLLTSRREERDWLGDLPARIALPQMPMQERLQMAYALVAKHGTRFIDVGTLLPLLRFTEGNPLAITIMVRQVLMNGFTSKKEVGQFVACLRAGQGIIDDDENEGRTKSLGASLRYGFEHAFNESERKYLAILHVFRDVVSEFLLIELVRRMPELPALTEVACKSLLDRAAEVGLLEYEHQGIYVIHPALPWFFRKLFDRMYSASVVSANSYSSEITRSFVKIMANMGISCFKLYMGGRHEVVYLLESFETNLMHAVELARQSELWIELTGVLQGIRELYHHAGRKAEWASLLDEILPDLVERMTDGSNSDLEETWGIITEYRVFVAIDRRDLSAAEEMQRSLLEWHRRRAGTAIDDVGIALNIDQQDRLMRVAGACGQLGDVLREKGDPECISAYEDSISLFERLPAGDEMVRITYNISRAFCDIASIRNIDRSQDWAERALMKCMPGDRRIGGILCQLGNLSYKRFIEARNAQRPVKELEAFLESAFSFAHRTLALTPENAPIELARIHNLIGGIYAETDDIKKALAHWHEAIRCAESCGSLFDAARTRKNMSIKLAIAGRLVEAREYACAALRNYEQFGEIALGDVRDTHALIRDIESALNG